MLHAFRFRTIPGFGVGLGLALLAQAASAEPTHLMIRALSEDAKFIGDHTGGVEVTLRDAATHTILSQGMIHGGTGDTDRIMTAPRTRSGALADAQTAGFDAVIDIARPTLVDVEARGPLAAQAGALTVRAQLWFMPGQPVIGDGLVLKFTGLLITPVLSRAADGRVHVAAKVTMLCGCPISPGGLWDEANYRITADVLDGGAVMQHLTLHYAGRPSEFATDLPPVSGPNHTLRIIATQSTAPNTGVVELPLP
jgi:hypothetical protein